MLRKIAASYLASGWSALIGLAFVPIYVRLLGYEAYGLVGFFASLQMWLATLDLGLATTLNRECARYTAGAVGVQTIRELLASLERIYAGIAVAAGLTVIALAHPIATRWLNAQALDAQSAVRAVMLMGLVFAVQWLGTLYRTGLSGLQQQVWLGWTACLFATVRAVGSVAVLTYVSATIDAFFVWQFVVGAVESAASAWRMHASLPRAPQAPGFSRAALGSVWRFAGGVSVLGLLGTVLTQLDKVLLARLLPLEQYGQFALLMPVAGALSLLCIPVVNVAFPRLGEMVSRGDETALRADYHRFAQLLTLSTAPAALILMAFPQRIVYLWIGDAAAAQAIGPVLAFWVFGTALNSLTHVPQVTQLAAGWTRLSIAVNCVSVVAAASLLLALTPTWGMIAAAWVWTGVNLFYLAVAVPLMHRRLVHGEFTRWLLGDVLAPTLAAGTVVLLAINALPYVFDAPGPVALATLGLAATFASCMSAPAGREVLRQVARRVALRRSPG